MLGRDGPAAKPAGYLNEARLRGLLAEGFVPDPLVKVHQPPGGGCWAFPAGQTSTPNPPDTSGQNRTHFRKTPSPTRQNPTKPDTFPKSQPPAPSPQAKRTRLPIPARSCTIGMMQP